MAKRKRETKPTTIDKRIRAGRGQGHGCAYKPWLYVQDVASQGLVHRVKGWKTGRTHHLLSNPERDYFYLLDWSTQVMDIREQYPLLPLEETQALAEQCGVRHPADPTTKQPVVLTTDFLVDVRQGNQCIQQARSVKPSDYLAKERVLEKLELERLYWQSRKVDWGIVTEREIPSVYAQNVRKIHPYREITDRLPAQVELSEIVQALTVQARSQQLCLKDLVQRSDATLKLPEGTSLTVVYHLIATHQWRTDLHQPLTLKTVLAQPGGEVTQ